MAASGSHQSKALTPDSERRVAPIHELPRRGLLGNLYPETYISPFISLLEPRPIAPRHDHTGALRVAIGKHLLGLKSGVVRFARFLAVAGIEHSQQPPARRLFLVRFWRRERLRLFRELVVYMFEEGHGPLAWAPRRERNHFFGVPSHGFSPFPQLN